MHVLGLLVAAILVARGECWWPFGRTSVQTRQGPAVTKQAPAPIHTVLITEHRTATFTSQAVTHTTLVPHTWRTETATSHETIHSTLTSHTSTTSTHVDHFTATEHTTHHTTSVSQTTTTTLAYAYSWHWVNLATATHITPAPAPTAASVADRLHPAVRDAIARYSSTVRNANRKRGVQTQSGASAARRCGCGGSCKTCRRAAHDRVQSFDYGFGAPCNRARVV